MPTEAHRQRNKRYMQTQDQIVVKVPKGARDQIKQYAASKGKSVNAFFLRLIEKEIGVSAKELAEEEKKKPLRSKCPNGHIPRGFSIFYLFQIRNRPLLDTKRQVLSILL